MSLFPTDKQRAKEAEKDSAAFAQMHSSLAKKYKELEEELKLTDDLNEKLRGLLRTIPECPMHGECIPYATNWIGNQIKRLDFLFEHHNICIGVSALGGPEIAAHGWSERGHGITYYEALDDLMQKREKALKK